MLRFRKLHLQNWKNFKEAQVDLQDRMFLVGPNASGKSNLLDALRFLRDLASLGGGFGDAVRRRGGVSAIRCLAARRPSHVKIGVELEAEQGESWIYELTFRQDSQRRPHVRTERVLHPEIVRLLPQMLARIQRRTKRQLFLSTHSPDLLRDSGIGLDETLLFLPRTEGVRIMPAGSDLEIRRLLEAGLS